MANDWYVRINNIEHGPLTSERLKQLAHQGKVTPDTLLKMGIAGHWTPARYLKGLFPETESRTAPTTATPPPQRPANSPPVHQEAPPSLPAARWYMREGDKLFGPYSNAELKEMAREGTISPAAQVKEGEHGNWMPFAFRTARSQAGKPHSVPSPSAAKIVYPPTAGEQADNVDDIAATWLEPTSQESPTPISREHAVPQNVERPLSSLPISGLPSPRHPLASATAERACPFCGETILAVATKCKHCGEWLTEDRSSTRQDGYRCPECQSVGIKKLSLAYAEGTSAISATSVGIGVGFDSVGIEGIGIGTASTTGTQQTVLAEKVKPPINPTSGGGMIALVTACFACSLILIGLLWPGGGDSHAEDWKFAAGLAVIIVLCIIGIALKVKSLPQYRARREEWGRSFVCLRCGRVFQVGNRNIRVQATVVNIDP